jgi:biopolymer transport protein ExbB
VNLVETGKRIMVGTGASAVLWLLVVLSIVSLGIILERAWIFVRRRGNVGKLRAELLDALGSGGFRRAHEAMSGSLHPAALVALRGLSLERGGVFPAPKQAEEAMEAEMIAQKGELEAGIGILATLGNNAPFVGLFGTVVGIVGAFDALGHGATSQLAAGAATSGGPAASLAVMSSIGEALVATAVGIGVAIPAVAAFNYFSRSTKKAMAGAEILMKEIVAYLEGRGMPGVPLGAPLPGRASVASVTMSPPDVTSRAVGEVLGGYSHGL